MRSTLPQKKSAPAPEAHVEAAGAVDVLATTEVPQQAPTLSVADGQEIPPALYSRFEAFELLGRGGMGSVYKARDLRLGRDVAVKLLFGADPELGGSVLREARSQALIVHPNVCEVYDAGTIDHARYIVMQLIDGDPFDKASTSMSLEERVRVIRQIASALHEAHRLGLVHRDVKPANIMVERGEDGAWKPYIMDFGLAREIGDSGQTVSGALMGTPQFMSPEQAAGKVRSLDRRTDVYCLGATLYAVLVGRPPIVKEGLAPLLQAIVDEDPVSPRQIDRDMPLDLDAIVMRCLEKHPARRYDSAKALGEDLQRFLDGEPVAALKRARVYALYRRARRHKWKLSIGSVTLAVATMFVIGFLSERARAEKQSTLSRELGESVKEMEYFLRTASGLPLHDIDRDRNVVRGRFKRIETRMNEAGPIGLGPGHYALGRGYLALQEPAEALSHLRQAVGASHKSVGLENALGMAFSELYKKALDETKRMEGEQKKKRIAAIEVEYKEPALRHLKAALAEATLEQTMETPAYVEGLIAFYEGRHEDALKKAREAFKADPALYEAKKLEADVHFAVGSKFGHDAAFDFNKMSESFNEAEAAYKEAAEIGRSDPAVHLAMCELYRQRIYGLFEHKDSAEPAFHHAENACKDAIAARPGDGAGYVDLAQAHAAYVWTQRGGAFHGAFAVAIRYAEDAVSRSMDNPVAPYVVAALWRAKALDENVSGLDVTSSIGRSVAGYEQALKIDPTFVWAQNELCSVLMMRGRIEIRRGVDPENTLNDATKHCSRAIDIAPDFPLPRRSLIGIQQIRAEYQVMLGRAPDDAITSAQDAIDALGRMNPHDEWLPDFRSSFALLSAAHAVDADMAPLPSLARVEAIEQEIEKTQPSSSLLPKIRAPLASLRALMLFQKDKDPSAEVQTAKAIYGSMITSKPNRLSNRVSLVEVEIIGLRAALREGKLEQAAVDEALAVLSPVLDHDRVEPRLYVALAEIHEIAAADAVVWGYGNAASRIQQGLDAVAKALLVHPRFSPAFACKGRLLLLRARDVKDPASKRENAKQAVEAFLEAMKYNPLFEKRIRKELREARGMAEMGR